MNRIEAGQKAEQEPIPREYAQLADTLDPRKNEISYPEALPEAADAKTKWEHADEMEMAFTKVLARVGGAAREAGDVLVGTEMYNQLLRVVQAQERLKRVAEDDLGVFYKEKQEIAAAEQMLEQMVRAREATDPAVRKKLTTTKDILKLVTGFQEDLKTKNVMEYFNRRSEMIEREGLPAEVAPATLPEVRVVTKPDRPAARRGETVAQEVGHAETIISDTMLAIDTNREITPLPSADAVSQKIESIGGIYKMQQDVIEAGGRVLARVAKQIREVGVLYGNAERKVA